MFKKISAKPFKAHLFALASYLGITLIFTYPLVLNFTTHMAGAGPGDDQIFYWNLWWFKRALVDLKTNPLFCDWILYPFGSTTVFSPLTVFNDVFSLFLHPFFNLVTIYNIILVFDFVVSAYGAFLLADYVIGNKKAAFIAGIIFAFCPYKFAHLPGHFSLTSTQWLPFYALYLLKTVEGGFSFKNSFLAGLFLLLVAFSDYYYLNYAFLFTFFYLVYTWAADKKLILNKGFAKSAAVAMFVAAVGFSPLVISAYKDFLYGSYAFGKISAYSEYVSDIAAFFTPSMYHPLFKKFTVILNSFIYTGGPAENLVFPGYTVIFLVVFGFIKFRPVPRQIKFWFYCAVAFFVLSLGPFLHVYGVEFKICPLPGYIMTFIPGLSGMRCFSRLVIMGMLCLSVAVAWACKMIFQRYLKPRAWAPMGNLAFFAFSGLVIFEFLPAPYPIYKFSVPEIYSEIAKEPGDFTLLEIPMKWYITGSHITEPAALEYQLAQTVHGKRLISGFIARGAPTQPEHYFSMPLLNKIHCLQKKLPFEKFYEEPDAKSALETVKALHIRYIIVHKNAVNQAAKRYVENHMPVKKRKIYDKEGIEVFMVAPQGAGAPAESNMALLEQGWYERELWGDKFYMNWSRGRRSLISFFSNKTGDKTLRFRAVGFPFDRDQNLRVYVNGRYLCGRKLPGVWADYSATVPAAMLKKGRNSVEFRYRTVKSPRSAHVNPGDGRRLAMAMSGFKVCVSPNNMP